MTNSKYFATSNSVSTLRNTNGKYRQKWLRKKSARVLYREQSQGKEVTSLFRPFKSERRLTNHAAFTHYSLQSLLPLLLSLSLWDISFLISNNFLPYQPIFHKKHPLAQYPGLLFFFFMNLYLLHLQQPGSSMSTELHLTFITTPKLAAAGLKCNHLPRDVLSVFISAEGECV